MPASAAKRFAWAHALGVRAAAQTRDSRGSAPKATRCPLSSAT